MTRLSKDPQAFTEQIAKRFREEFSPATVQVTAPLELLVEGQRVDLDDLQRVIRSEDETEPSELVQRFIDAFANSRRLNETPLPFEMVKGKILPQIRSLDRLRGTRPGFIAAQPYINDTVIIYMIDWNDAATPLSTEQLIRW